MLPIDEHDRKYFFPNGDCLSITRIIAYTTDDCETHYLKTTLGKVFIVRNTWSYMESTMKDLYMRNSHLVPGSLIDQKAC